jgi:uncharacterized protein
MFVTAMIFTRGGYERMQARDIIRRLSLQPHPEGGWYREIYRSGIQVEGPRGRRSAVTTIYYLLERGQVSRWHVVDADEIWHFYGGAPLELLAYDPRSRELTRHLLDAPGACHPTGSGRTGETAYPAVVVTSGVWQAARTQGEYSLVGCSVGPGFEFADFHFVSSLPDHEAPFAQTLREWEGLL